MPDLTIEYIRTCKQNIYWETIIKGSKGDDYTVTYCESRNGPSEMGWFCTCPHFTYRHKECNHIKQAKLKKCDWNWEAFMGQHASPNPDGTCPKCGGETQVIKVGV